MSDFEMLRIRNPNKISTCRIHRRVTVWVNYKNKFNVTYGKSMETWSMCPFKMCIWWISFKCLGKVLWDYNDAHGKMGSETAEAKWPGISESNYG